jgi:hypothetical protein
MEGRECNVVLFQYVMSGQMHLGDLGVWEVLREKRGGGGRKE